jgi:hypothetical protein
VPVCEVLVSAGIGNIPADLGGAMRTYLAYVCGAFSGGVAVRRALEPGPG